MRDVDKYSVNQHIDRAYKLAQDMYNEITGVENQRSNKQELLLCAFVLLLVVDRILLEDIPEDQDGSSNDIINGMLEKIERTYLRVDRRKDTLEEITYSRTGIIEVT